MVIILPDSGQFEKFEEAIEYQNIKGIIESLGEGETGVLFIGASHNVIPSLPADIKVVQVKEAVKVKEYHRTLVSKRRYDQYLQRLGEYLASPVLGTPF